MSLQPIYYFLKTHTTSTPCDEYRVRDTVNKFFKENSIPKLKDDEKVFIRGNTLCLTTPSSIRAYEVHCVQQQLVHRIQKVLPMYQHVIEIRFL